MIASTTSTFARCRTTRSARCAGCTRWLGEPVTEEFEDGMRAWWAENAENREPHPKADPEAFGLDLNAIRPLFATYVDTYIVEHRMAIDLTGGIDPEREYHVRRTAGQPRDAGFGEFLGRRRSRRRGVAAHRYRSGRRELGGARRPGQRRLRRRAGVPTARRGHEPAAHRPRRSADGAGRGPARVHVRRTVRRVDDDVRRAGRRRRRRPN